MKIYRPHIICFLLCCCSQIQLSGQDPIPATLLGRWTGNEIPGSSAYSNAYNEVWGITLDGREYAVIGTTLGTHFIDVTRPQDAEEVAFVAGASRGPNLIHRDYHNYGCYLYAVSDEGSGSLQIIDVSTLPDSVSVVYDSPEFFTRSHNIFIDSTNAILYACFARGGGTTTTPLKLLDISDPIQPRELATYNSFGGGTVSHVHDCYVEDGLAFLNLGNDGMAIVDYSNPLQPVFRSTLTDYPFAGYNHSGWPTADLQYYYLADESHGMPVKVLDVSDNTEMVVLNSFDADSPAELSIPHNQVVACNYLYISYYYDGLQVYDISNAAQPQRVSFFNTSSRSHRKSYEGAWGVYPFLPSGNILVSDMQEGLFIVSGPNDSCNLREQLTLNCDALLPSAVTEQVIITGSVYPQPARDYVQIDFLPLESQEKVNVQLLDIHGRVLQRWEGEIISENLKLNFARSYANGIYFLQIQAGNQFITQKILIHS